MDLLKDVVSGAGFVVWFDSIHIQSLPFPEAKEAPRPSKAPFKPALTSFFQGDAIVIKASLSGKDLAFIPSSTTSLAGVIRENALLNNYLNDELEKSGFKENCLTALTNRKENLKEKAVAGAIALAAKRFVQTSEGVSGKHQEFKDTFICPVDSQKYRKIKRVQELCGPHFSTPELREVSERLGCVIKATDSDEDVRIKSIRIKDVPLLKPTSGSQRKIAVCNNS